MKSLKRRFSITFATRVFGANTVEPDTRAILQNDVNGGVSVYTLRLTSVYSYVPCAPWAYAPLAVRVAQ